MATQYDILMEKIRAMARNAPLELHNELYPKHLGKAVEMQSPELRLVVISRYEGIGIVLRELGTDTKELSEKIKLELEKI